MKPVIALVGRPNVGKSTLFNRPHADARRHRGRLCRPHARSPLRQRPSLGKHEFIVIDTGGFEPDAGSGIFKEMAKQTRQAVAEADVVIFVVDAREGLSAQDHDIARELRRLGKPRLLAAANKAEGMNASAKLAEFYELGFGEVHAVSAAPRPGQVFEAWVELALEPLRTCPTQRRRRRTTARATSRSAWLSRASPQRSGSKIDPHQHDGWAKNALWPSTCRAPRATPSSVPFERNGQPLRADRYGRLAPQGQGVRGHREVLGDQDAAGHRRRERGCAGAGRHARRDRPGRSHCRLHPGKRPGPWSSR